MSVCVILISSSSSTCLLCCWSLMTCWMALAPSTGSPKACVVSHLPHLCWSSPHFSTALVPVALYPLACQETAVVQIHKRPIKNVKNEHMVKKIVRSILQCLHLRHQHVVVCTSEP